MQPKPFRRTSRKLNSLRVASLLKKGGLIAHYTSTLPGVAALPKNRKGLLQMQRFKGRNGPFLLLADSKQGARRWIRWYPSSLRRLVRSAWPGQSTLIVPGSPGLPRACYQKGMLAIRVDGDVACRRLVRACGGLLLSSSLNRRGEQILKPSHAVQMRMHRFLAGRAGIGSGSGAASSIFRVGHCGAQKVR